MASVAPLTAKTLASLILLSLMVDGRPFVGNTARKDAQHRQQTQGSSPDRGKNGDRHSLTRIRLTDESGKTQENSAVVIVGNVDRVAGDLMGTRVDMRFAAEQRAGHLRRGFDSWLRQAHHE